MVFANDVNKIRELLDNAHRPLIFFDDDPDGLTSFLMIYRYIGDGRGVPIKTSPDLSPVYLKTVQDYSPDLVIILDKPLVSEEFITKLKVPLIWIDHHPVPEESELVKHYYNPLNYDKNVNFPTSYCVYEIIKHKFPDLIWLGMIGCVGDWFLPDFKKEFSDKYSDLFDIETKEPPQALFDQKIGTLVQIFDSCLKGTKKKVETCIKILTRIESPYEIINQLTPKGKFVYKHFSTLNERYKELLESAMKSEGDIVEFHYHDIKFSFTSMLSNELLYRNYNKFILVAREKSGFMHCSLRSKVHDVQSLLNSIIPEFSQAYGGGHKNACGANIRADEYQDFVNKIKQELSNFIDN